MLALLLTLQTWLELSIHPAVPWVLLTLLVGLLVRLSRYWVGLWEWIDSQSPDGVWGNILQGLPAALGGALLSVPMSGGDWAGAWKGALMGALAPIGHHLLKASQLPYTGAVRAPFAKATKALSTAALIALACFGLTSCAAARTANEWRKGLCDALGDEKEAAIAAQAAELAITPAQARAAWDLQCLFRHEEASEDSVGAIETLGATP